MDAITNSGAHPSTAEYAVRCLPLGMANDWLRENMIQGLFGDGSVYKTLRGGLDDDLVTARTIGHRVANAANGNAAAAAQGGAQAEGAGAAVNETDLEGELVRLVNTTFRYDAESRLLREAYARLRTAIGTRG